MNLFIKNILWGLDFKFDALSKGVIFIILIREINYISEIRIIIIVFIIFNVNYNKIIYLQCWQRILFLSIDIAHQI
jgi:hypothetical protein